jgi:hypothetical protein
MIVHATRRLCWKRGCKAREEITTDPWNHGALVIRKFGHTCQPEVVQTPDPTLGAKCIDCGEPCRKQRCLSCSNRANSYGRKPLPKCPCGAQLKHPQAKFCSECRTEKNRVDNRERGQRRREAA